MQLLGALAIRRAGLAVEHLAGIAAIVVASEIGDVNYPLRRCDQRREVLRALRARQLDLLAVPAHGTVADRERVRRGTGRRGASYVGERRLAARDERRRLECAGEREATLAGRDRLLFA